MRYKSHNNLLRYFIEPHDQLPASYLKSCREFFSWLKQCNKEGFKAPSSKLQASSDKRQAATCTTRKKGIDINHENN